MNIRMVIIIIIMIMTTMTTIMDIGTAAITTHIEL
jgi:hypothetical protein